ncbi:hypothetical protein [Lacrimispora sp.]|uniref:hypothetical protein n=1 Tax=Lacrimispora sp. TaxID=2719234 RepID=UPI002FDADA2D
MKQNDYYSSIHRLGRWSTLAGIALMFMVPMVTTLVYGVKLNIPVITAAAIQLCIVFIPTQLTEVISFSPILGAGGTYLSFITGNVMNMKLPAAAAGHRLMNVEPHSDEGEVVSVLAIGMSSITTTIIIFAGMFIFTPFIHYLSNPVLQPGFSSVMPALLGTMLLPHLRKNFPLAVTPLIISTAAGVIFASTYGQVQGYLLLFTMIISVLAAIAISSRAAK